MEAAEQAHPTVAEPVKVVPRIISSAPKVLPEPAPSTTRSSVEEPRQLSAQPIASSSRPTIKLKVGAQSKAQDEPSSKPAKRKVKISESPSSHTPDAPPPYVDDGSHDILQEVLAIEREKNQQRQRSISEKEKAVPSAIPTKRKKIDDVDDDDILELVTPVKKERPSPPEPSSSSSISIRKPAFTTPSVKIKKDKVLEVPRPPTTSVSPGASLKGKEKEVDLMPPAASSNKPRKLVQYTPINEKKCKELLKVLGRVPESYLFVRPVDPVLDGCPTCVFNIPIVFFCFSNG